MTPDIITGNGRPTETKLPCKVEELLVAKKQLPRSVMENDDNLEPR